MTLFSLKVNDTSYVLLRCFKDVEGRTWKLGCSVRIISSENPMGVTVNEVWIVGLTIERRHMNKEA